ncbi:MAG: hypothetical protein M3N52_12010 [Actinomycetota bacterium]|nr:hypothetical protein [Actinomycetota bacterium]
MSKTLDEVRRISEEVEARTGWRAFQYVSEPTPTSRKIVFTDTVVRTEGEALAYILTVQAEVEAGRWDHWNCRNVKPGCPWSFHTEAERDAHEAERHG